MWVGAPGMDVRVRELSVYVDSVEGVVVGYEGKV